MDELPSVRLSRYYRRFNGRRYYVVTSKSVPGLFLGGHDYKKIVADIEPAVRFLLMANRKLKWGGKYRVIDIPAPRKPRARVSEAAREGKG